jgi:hypothetical protein
MNTCKLLVVRIQDDGKRRGKATEPAGIRKGHPAERAGAESTSKRGLEILPTLRSQTTFHDNVFLDARIDLRTELGCENAAVEPWASLTFWE